MKIGEGRPNIKTFIVLFLMLLKSSVLSRRICVFNDIYFNVDINVKKNLARADENIAGRLWLKYYCNNMHAMDAWNDSSRQPFFLVLKVPRLLLDF